MIVGPTKGEPVISIRIYDTPIRVKVIALVNVIALWLVVSWLEMRWHPERDLWQSVLVGFAGMVLLLVADIGHAVAHIFSARYARAPMDEVYISMGMPRTRYSNDDVPANVHRMRAAGGPIFSALGLLISIAVYGLAAEDTIARGLATWSTIGHGFILVGSLLPLPMVDGGALLKWTLVENGRTETEADEVVQRVNTMMGILAGIIGIGLIAVQMWFVGLIMLGVGGVALGAAAGVIR
jgi:hypothetical protein